MATLASQFIHQPAEVQPRATLYIPVIAAHPYCQPSTVLYSPSNDATILFEPPGLSHQRVVFAYHHIDHPNAVLHALYQKINESVRVLEIYVFANKILLFVLNLNHSVLFALNTRSSPFVLPMKSLAQMELPERVHAFDDPADAAHLAFPEASEVRTYPSEAHERILSHWKVPVPTTSSFEDGPVVPIQTEPPLSMVTFELSFGPICNEFAIEFVIPFQIIITPSAEPPVFDAQRITEFQ
jgi:hypothetical protein